MAARLCVNAQEDAAMDDRQTIMRLNSALRAAQQVLQDYVLPGGPSQEEAIRRLTEILDEEGLLELQKALEGRAEAAQRRRRPDEPLPYR
jgi:hypothetical protein